MTRVLALATLLALSPAAVPTAAAQQDPTAGGRISLRAVLHNPVDPYAEMFVQDATGSLVRLNLALEGLTQAQTVSLSDGRLQLFSSDNVDAAKPLEHLAAFATVPSGTKRAIAFIFPSTADAKVPYRLMVINDGPAAFPKAESRVVNLTSLSLAMKAGEHSVKLPPAAVSRVPKVARRNDLNQAQTEFYRQGAGENDWVLLAERPMQFTDHIRNIILVFQMPNVPEPQLRTLVDTDLP